MRRPVEASDQFLPHPSLSTPMLFAALSFAVAFAVLCIDVTVDLTAERRIKSVYYTLILTPFIATVFGSITLVSFTMLFYYSLHAPPEAVQLAQALTKVQGAMMILYFSISQCSFFNG